MDNLTPEKRSERMSKIKGKDTKPEMIVRRFLHANGFRYKLHDKSLPGRPDIKLTRYKTVIMINGCFWHGHEKCRQRPMPVSNHNYWKTKIYNNKRKDELNLCALKNLGWRVLVVWECELKKKVREATLTNLIAELKGQ